MSYAETRRIIDVDSHVIELDDFLINAARPDERAFDDGGVPGEPSPANHARSLAEPLAPPTRLTYRSPSSMVTFLF